MAEESLKKDSHSENTKRIAKNTGLLYIRTIVMMLISLYTSRIVLETLGVDNYGINNVVGGVVGMFSIISGSLSGSISRFLTFALGEGNIEKLRKIFSLSVSIQILIGLGIIVVGEIGGLWFISHKLNISPDRMIAAHWVFQCGLASFFMGLISVPYNACLIAHERMGVFAYMTIVDATAKLLTAYVIFITPFDKLITFAILNLCVAVFMRIFYGWYCVRNFEECRYEFKSFDKGLAKEMTSFAWWGFFGNTAWMFNTQGVNILINMFFGVVYNAARGVAAQVEGAVLSFVGNFSTAVNPQITKSYASSDYKYLYSIICSSTKFIFYLIILFAIPLWFEAHTVLSIWLTKVPSDAAIFLKLSLICSILTTSANPLLMAILATGKIKKYEIVTTIVGCLVFPFTYVVYKLGAPITMTYYIYMTIYTILIGVKMWFAKRLISMPLKMFIQLVIVPCIVCISIALTLPTFIALLMEDSIWRLVIICLVTVPFTCIVVFFFGMTEREKAFVRKHVMTKFSFLNKYDK